MYTKGKWELKVEETFVNIYEGKKQTERFSIMAGDKLIATVWAENEFRNSETPPQAEQSDNARLIAAAPELLAACKAIEGFAIAYIAPDTGVERYAITKEDYQAIQVAITKAEGK